jgi:hypothetical protein
MNPRRIGFSLPLFDLRKEKNHGWPGNMPANVDPTRFGGGRLQAGTFGASRCSPERERYGCQPNSTLIGGPR